jgi:hypothetical protein
MKPTRRPTKMEKPTGPRSAGMFSHGGKAQKSAGRLSMKNSPSLNGISAFREEKVEVAQPVKKTQFTVAIEPKSDE